MDDYSSKEVSGHIPLASTAGGEDMALRTEAIMPEIGPADVKTDTIAKLSQLPPGPIKPSMRYGIARCDDPEPRLLSTRSSDRFPAAARFEQYFLEDWC